MVRRWYVVVFVFYGVLYFWDFYYTRGENRRGFLYSDVLVTTVDRQRPLEGDFSFLKTKLSSR